MAVPAAPANICVTATWSGNLITWDAVSSATKYTMYWEFQGTSIPSFYPWPGDWYVYEKHGDETEVNTGGGLFLLLPDLDSQIIVAQYNVDLPSYHDDFTMSIDLKNYQPDDVSLGHLGRLWLNSTGLSNNYFYVEFKSNATNTLTMRCGYRINGGTFWTGTGSTEGAFKGIAYLPPAFRIKRTSNILYGYYMDNTSEWVELFQKDFSTYAAYLNSFQIRSEDTSLHGGGITLGDWVMDPEPYAGKRYVDNVVSPYTHTIPIMCSRNIHAYHLTASNADGEGARSDIVYMMPWQHYRLGPDRSNSIELFPEWDFKYGETSKNNNIRTDSGILYTYEIYDYNEISFTAKYVPASEAAIVNSWWATQTKLQWFTELGSTSTVTSIMIGNNNEPFEKFERCGPEYFTGKIILEEYI